MNTKVCFLIKIIDGQICFQEFVKDIKGIKQQIFNEHKLKSTESSTDQPKSVLDRFKSKKKS